MDLLDSFQLREGVVGNARVSHFTFLDQFRNCRPTFLQVFIRDRVMDLVKVDGFDAQAPQTVFHLAANACGLKPERSIAASVFFPDNAALGGDDNFLVPPGKRPVNDLFGMAKTVNGSRVDPVYAQVERLVDSLDGIRIILRPPAMAPVIAPDRPGTLTDGSQIEICEA